MASGRGRAGGRRKLEFSVTESAGNASPVCSLCERHRGKLSSPKQWRTEAAQALVQTNGVSPQGLVCLPCRKDIPRVLCNDGHIPRWEKAKERSKSVCIILNYNEFTLLHYG